MSYLAAILLMVLPEEEAYAGLCQVVGAIEGYFVPTMWELLEDGKLFKLMLEREMPEVHNHLVNNGILPLMFICKYFMTMYSQLPWPTVLRIFDFYLFEGKLALFRFGMAIMSILQEELLGFASIDKLLPFLLEPQSRKLSHHILVPHALHVPIESYMHHALMAYRAEQDILGQVASMGTPVKRAPTSSSSSNQGNSTPVKSAPTNTSSVSGAGGNASFFQRFMDSVATPVRATIKRRIDPSSGSVVPTPPAAKRAFAPLSPVSPSAARLNRGPVASSPRTAAPNAIKASLNTPPMFEGMKKRNQRDYEDENEQVQSPFGSAKKAGLFSPDAKAQEMTLTPKKSRTESVL